MAMKTELEPSGKRAAEESAEAAKSVLARKREEAAEQARLEEWRRDVPPGVGEIEECERQAKSAKRLPLRLYGAILRAQAKIETVRKNGENPHFKSRYATLDEVWETVRRAVNEAGLVVFCTIEKLDGERAMVTHLVEAASGEEISCAFPIAAAANTPQAIGSAMTYARRYTLSALLEIVTGDGADDDGEAATNRAPTKGEAAKNPSAQAAADALGF